MFAHIHLICTHSYAYTHMYTHIHLFISSEDLLIVKNNNSKILLSWKSLSVINKLPDIRQIIFFLFFVCSYEKY